MGPLAEAVLFTSIYSYCSVMINVLYFRLLIRANVLGER